MEPTYIEQRLLDEIKDAEEDIKESSGLDMNSYGAGYDQGYRDALVVALTIVRGE